jgi:membrane fusion protein (multidrug efflux system)
MYTREICRAAVISAMLGFSLANVPARLCAGDVARVEGMVLPLHQVSVSSRVQGLIESIPVKEGDEVTVGQPLAQLFKAEEELEEQRTSRVVAVKTYDAEGTQELLKKDMVRKDEALEKRTEMEIAILQHQLAQVSLEKKIIRSPLAGVVCSKKKEPGEWVEPGAVIFEVVDFDSVYVQLLLSFEQAVGLQLGESIRVEFPQLSAPNAFSGKIDFIDPRVDASSGFQRVKILLANPGRRILPGNRAIALLPTVKP